MLAIIHYKKHRRQNDNTSRTKRSCLLCLYVPPPLPKSSALATEQEPVQHSCTRTQYALVRSLICSRLYVPEHKPKQYMCKYHRHITSDCVLRAFVICSLLLRTASSSESTRLALSVRSPEPNRQTQSLLSICIAAGMRMSRQPNVCNAQNR